MATRYFLDTFKAKPKGRKRVCATYHEPGDTVQIVLYQRGIDRFCVQYGMQIDDELTYAQAASKLGQALMHDLANESKLDNRHIGER